MLWRLLVVLSLGAVLTGLRRPGDAPHAPVIGLPAVAAADPPAQPKVDEQHELYPALKLAYASLQALDDVKDYTATFTKRERFQQKLRKQVCELKFREDPFSVYLLFVDPNKGREVLYVDGANKGQLLAHESGVLSYLGTVPLLPTSKDAMDDNHYPITMIGMRNLLKRVIEQWEYEGGYGEISVEFLPQAQLDKVPCEVIRATHPKPRKQFKYQETRLFLDRETRLPIRVEQYAFPKAGEQEPPLWEEYTYSNIQLNVGLTDRDFDPKNPKYSFPR